MKYEEKYLEIQAVDNGWVVHYIYGTSTSSDKWTKVFNHWFEVIKFLEMYFQSSNEDKERDSE